MGKHTTFSLEGGTTMYFDVHGNKISKSQWKKMYAAFKNRQEIIRAAHRQRNAEAWRVLGRLWERVTSHRKALRQSRWIAVHHGS